jgi:hypothetical protein
MQGKCADYLFLELLVNKCADKNSEKYKYPTAIRIKTMMDWPVKVVYLNCSLFVTAKNSIIIQIE